MSTRKEIADAFHKGQADCIAALTAENERLQGVLTANAEMLTYRETEVSVAATRIAELEAALKRCKDAATDLRSGGFNEWEIADEIEDAAAALKGPDA